MKMYSVFVGYSGMESQEEFQGNLDSCKGYVLAIFAHCGATLTLIEVEELQPEHSWWEDTEDINGLVNVEFNDLVGKGNLVFNC